MTEKHKILVVDDEPSIRDSLRLLLNEKFEVATADSGNQALELINQSLPDLVLLDVMMPGLSGIDTLLELRQSGRNVPVIMLTADNSAQSAVQAMKAGALDYLNKPFDVEQLTNLLVNILASDVNAVKIVSRNTINNEMQADCGPLVGTAPKMTELFDKIKVVAARDTTVLITGESGTGKELVAKQIHAFSARKDQPFVAINCAAIPESLIESELFGHEKGAFTSAIDRRIGYFELANGGTLFLDEIGELSLNVQVKMLRFLQEQEFYRVGQSKPTKVNVRVVAATNKSLEKLVVEKKFREDLFYRINVIHLELPALKERIVDLNKLLDHFVQKFSPAYGGKQLQFSEESLQIMQEYTWPGNVRELENVVEALMALSVDTVVQAEDLPTKLKQKDDLHQFDPKIFDGSLSFPEEQKNFESEMIIRALKKSNYVQTKAAEMLGISRRILKYKMDKLGISENYKE